MEIRYWSVNCFILLNIKHMVLYLSTWNGTKLLFRSNFPIPSEFVTNGHSCFRVRTVLRTSSGDVVSVLSIKSAIIDDGGNYTCRHGDEDSEDTVRIIVVDGELIC